MKESILMTTNLKLETDFDLSAAWVPDVTVVESTQWWLQYHTKIMYILIIMSTMGLYNCWDRMGQDRLIPENKSGIAETKIASCK